MAGGYAMSQLRVPLPWMIGPMVVAATISLAGKGTPIPTITRPIGQIIVAASVGLFFTPAALTAVGQEIVPMVVVAILTIAAGFLAALVMMRLGKVDIFSAGLAAIPGGPIEMALLANRHGAQADTVALAQILRIAMLVLIIPPLLVAIDGEFSEIVRGLSDGPTDYGGAALLLVIAVSGGFFLWAIRMTLPFFLGPLAASAAASALLVPVSAVPFLMLAGAQVLLGVWLGSMFDRQLFTRSPMLLVAILASTIVLMLLTTAMALSLSWMTGNAWQTMVLATAPGSVTEMALTAKILEHEVALVTAYHVVRIFIILPLIPLIFFLLARFRSQCEEPQSEA